MLVRRILGDVQNGERDTRRLVEGAMEWAADNLLPLTLPTVGTPPIHLSDADVAATELERPNAPVDDAGRSSRQRGVTTI